MSTGKAGLPEASAAFVSTRAAGLDRLSRFIPHAGREYAARRNEDRGPGRNGHVSMLSPWLRHRMVREDEVLEAVLAAHDPADCAKFVEEVFWRTYFKGHLETHPAAWSAYRTGLRAALEQLAEDPELRARHAAAIAGRTGIDCFDAWVAELRDTGYLHNHARMWFASIWVFTLRLPWTLGADFTYRHFMDGDPASNTLSWRWVCGLHTRGKNYLARSENIARWSAGRFAPRGLIEDAAPLVESESPARVSIPPAPALPPDGPLALLLTEEDLHPESLGIDPRRVVAIAGATSVAARSPLQSAQAVHAFTEGAMGDALDRAAAHFQVPALRLESLDRRAVAAWLGSIRSPSAAGQPPMLVTAWLPVGPVREGWDAIAAGVQALGLDSMMLRRPMDERAWPQAARGFFQFREKIPALLGHHRRHA